LRIELDDFEEEKRWEKYSNFSTSDASDFRKRQRKRINFCIRIIFIICKSTLEI